jgi:hypothetical protein
MQPTLFAGGIVAAVATLWHGVGGHMAILRRVDERALGVSVYGDRNVTRRMLVGCWHMFTAVLLWTSATLLWLSVTPELADGHLLARSIGALFGAFATVYIVCAADRPWLFVRVPQWVALLGIAALAWLGAG